MKPIHNCNYSAHNKLQILCDCSWDEPVWSSPETEKEIASLPKGVHLADSGRLYTFDTNKVSCEECLDYAKQVAHI